MAHLDPGHVPFVRLGDTCNLVNGLNHTWRFSNSQDTPYNPPPLRGVLESTLYEQLATPTSKTCLTKHETVENLLSDVFPFFLYHTNKRGSDLGSGTLLASDPNREAKLADLGKYLGVTLTQPDLRFVLVKQVKTVAVAEHPAVTQGGRMARCTTKEFDNEGAQLPEGSPSASKFKAVCDFIEKWGSHFVGVIKYGETLFQVFSYSKLIYESVVLKIWDELVTTPLLFQGYTALRNEGTQTGAAHEVGNLLSLANDPLFVQSLVDNAWVDSQYAKANNICALFGVNPVARNVYSQLSAVAPIEIYFANIVSTVSVRKVPLFTGTLKGLFSAKYGTQSVRVKFTATTIPDAYSTTTSTFNLPAPSALITPQVSLYREVLDLCATFGSSTGTSNSLVLVANVLNVTDRIVLAARHIVIVAGLIVGANTESKVPEIVVADSVFDNWYFYYSNVIGYLQISTLSGKRRILVDGNFSFALVPDATDCSSVVITQPQQEPIPSSLLDARVPASSASTIGDRLGLLFNASFAAMQLHLHEDKVPATHAPEFGYLDYVSKLIPPRPTSKLLQLVPTQMLKLKAFGRPSLVRDVPAYWKDEEVVQSVSQLAGSMNMQLKQCQTQIALLGSSGGERSTNPKVHLELLLRFVDVIAQIQQQLFQHSDVQNSHLVKDVAVMDDAVERLTSLVEEKRSRLIEVIHQDQSGCGINRNGSELGFLTIANIFSLSFHSDSFSAEHVSTLSDILQKVGRLTTLIASLRQPTDKEINEKGTSSLSSELSDLPSDDEWKALTTYLADLKTAPQWAGCVNAFVTCGIEWLNLLVQRECCRFRLYNHARLHEMDQSFLHVIEHQKLLLNHKDFSAVIKNVDLFQTSVYFGFCANHASLLIINVLQANKVVTRGAMNLQALLRQLNKYMEDIE